MYSTHVEAQPSLHEDEQEEAQPSLQEDQQEEDEPSIHDTITVGRPKMADVDEVDDDDDDDEDDRDSDYRGGDTTDRPRSEHIYWRFN